MARKTNAKHDKRGPSHYPERLEARGETNTSVRMKFYDADGKKHDTIRSARPSLFRDRA